MSLRMPGSTALFANKAFKVDLRPMQLLTHAQPRDVVRQATAVATGVRSWCRENAVCIEEEDKLGRGWACGLGVARGVSLRGPADKCLGGSIKDSIMNKTHVQAAALRPSGSLVMHPPSWQQWCVDQHQD